MPELFDMAWTEFWEQVWFRGRTPTDLPLFPPLTHVGGSHRTELPARLNQQRDEATSDHNLQALTVVLWRTEGKTSLKCRFFCLHDAFINKIMTNNNN